MSWVEKYRPRKPSDFVGNKDIKDVVINSLDEERNGGDKCQHLALLGIQGVGKTSLINIIKFKYGFKDDKGLDTNVLTLNGTKEGKIDILRTKVDRFFKNSAIPAKTLTKPLGRKLLVIEEIDKGSDKFKQALRFDSEHYSSRVLIIMTGNYETGIPGPILSRTLVLRFRPVDVETLTERLEFISKKEKLDVDVADLIICAGKAGGLPRDAIILLQAFKHGGKIAGDIKFSDKVKDFLKILRESPYFAYEEMRKLVSVQSNSREIIKEILSLVVLNEKAPKLVRKEVAIVLGEYDYRLVMGSSPLVQLTSLVSDLIKIIYDKKR